MRTTSTHSSGSKVEPLRPPPRRFFQSRTVQIVSLLLTPFLVTLLLLWGAIGLLLRLPALSVALTATAITWTLYLCLPDLPVTLIDWPIVFTLGYALLVFLNKTPRVTVPSITLFLVAYAIVRGLLYDTGTTHNSDSTTQRLVNALIVVGSVLPWWVATCRLRVWVPADDATLEEVEKRIYKQYVVTDHTAHTVAGLGTVHVSYCGDSTRLPPRTLVLVHGYMAGNAFWAANLQTLAKCFNVYAVEWKGIGRSIRPTFNPKTEQEMDDFFVESLEDWRRVLQLDRFILCGHSMGAMYTSYYVEKYPQHVEHLILVSPAGVVASGKTNDELIWPVQVASRLKITPMSLIRFAGPFGPSLVKWVLRKRIQWVPEANIIRTGEMDFDDISLYCYHNWALKASGDIALYTHLHPGASAQRRPLNEIFTPTNVRVPLTVLYGGGGDWMPSEHGEAVVRRLEKTHYAAFRLVPLAGHQVFMDNPSDFNQIVIDAVHAYERAVANATNMYTEHQ